MHLSLHQLDVVRIYWLLATSSGQNTNNNFIYRIAAHKNGSNIAFCVNILNSIAIYSLLGYFFFFKFHETNKHSDFELKIKFSSAAMLFKDQL